VRIADFWLEERTRKRVLRVSWVLLGLTLIHDVDHVRQGRALGLELYMVGLAAVAASLTVLWLAFARSNLTQFAAASLGLGTIVGVLAVHVTPPWWPLSDSYGAAGVDLISWVIVIAMMLAGATLSAVSLSAMRPSSRLPARRPPHS
jgi:hypothetical protein